MFAKVKQFFTRRKSAKKDKYQIAESVSFKDLSGNQITLEIKQNGNDTILLIRDKDTKVLCAIDQELSLLINVLLQSYSLHGVFPDLEEIKGN